MTGLLGSESRTIDFQLVLASGSLKKWLTKLKDAKLNLL